MTWDHAALLATALVVAGMLVYVLRHRAPEVVLPEEDLRREVEDLRATVNTLRRQLDEADKRIRMVESERAQRDAQIAALQGENTAMRHDMAVLKAQLTAQECAEPLLPAKPLLIVSGAGPRIEEIFARDRAALRRANVPFHRLLNASKASISAELRRRRQDGTLYPWVLVSAHAGTQGIELADGFAAGEWWGTAFDGIRVVVLAACSASTVADELAGLVDMVVWFSETVQNDDAADFSYAFWRRLVGGTPAVQAYAEALRECPQVAEFVDMRQN
jgi:hypothetical protein